MLFNEYFFHFWENVFFPYLDQHNIKQVVHLGDFGERQKYMTFAIADQVHKRFFMPLRDRGVKITILVGNHDTPSRTDNKVNVVKELFSVWNNIITLIDGPCDVMFGDVPICMLPWIHKDNYEETLRHIQETTNATVAMGHLELEGFEMDKGNISRHGLSRDLFKKFNMVMSGHYHHKSTDGRIFYLGNTYEITWADYDDPRGFHIFDTETNDLTFIQNPSRMFHKLYYRDELPQHPLDIANSYVRVIVEKKDNPKMFEEYMRQVHEYEPAKVDVQDIDSETSIPQDEVSGDTNTLIANYIDNLPWANVTDNTKGQLKSLMLSLYNEAQAQANT